MSPLDPQLLDDLARCFMRAALDECLRTLAAERETMDEGLATPQPERPSHAQQPAAAQ